MSRPRAGYIGFNRVPAASAMNSLASGVWTLREAEAMRRLATWPTAPRQPEAPSGLSVAAGNASLTPSWTAPYSDLAIARYIVEYTPSGGSPQTVSTGTTATSYTITGLTNGTTYTVRVAAVSDVGAGAYSATATGTPVSGVDVEYLVVAGGGGGHSFNGGGGAGGFLSGTLLFSPGTAVSVSVGQGGNIGGNAGGGTDTKGANSVFGNLTAIGGGGCHAIFSTAVNDGGSGAGSINGFRAGIGTSGQGNNGGTVGASDGGGGGGAGSAGSGINGGTGKSSSITGSALLYAGGGAGTFDGSGGTHGLGATGNAANRGGGGSTNQRGGSGVVVLAMQSPLASVGSGLSYTLNTSGRPGYYVYTFTSGSGTVTI